MQSLALLFSSGTTAHSSTPFLLSDNNSFFLTHSHFIFFGQCWDLHHLSSYRNCSLDSRFLYINPHSSNSRLPFTRPNLTIYARMIVSLWSISGDDSLSLRNHSSVAHISFRFLILLQSTPYSTHSSSIFISQYSRRALTTVPTIFHSTPSQSGSYSHLFTPYNLAQNLSSIALYLNPRR